MIRQAVKPWHYLALAVVLAFFFYPFASSFSDAPDYGVFLNGADLLNHGAVPSRDFVEPQGPGSFVWLAVAFRVFGTTFGTARGLLMATGTGIGLLTFHLSRKLGGSGLLATVFVAATSIPLLPINSPHYDSNLFALAALAAFLMFWKRTAIKWPLVLAAVLCGLTTWIIQQKGCYLAASLITATIVLLRSKALRPSATFAVVFAAVALLPFLYFAAVHALPDVWFANFVWPMTSYSEINAAPYGFPLWQNLNWLTGSHANQPGVLLLDIATALPILLVAALPLLLPVAAWKSKSHWLGVRLLPYWLAAYSLWAAELHRLDIGHLRNGILLMAMMFFTICELDCSRYLRSAGLAIIACTAIAGSLSWQMNWSKNRIIETRRGKIAVDADQPLLAFLESHTQPEDEVFVYPYQPIYYFAERLRNPTRYSYLLYHFHTPAQFVDAMQSLERKKVQYVIIDTAMAGAEMSKIFPAYHHPDQSKLIAEPYFNTHYRMTYDLGRFHVLQRLDEAR